MTRQRRLVFALALNAVVVVIQGIGGLAAGSMALLADAAHNLTDVAAVVISLIAVRLTLRPATPRQSFGWHRSTILAAQANAAGILVVTLLIFIEAVGRLREPEPVASGVVIVIAGLGLVANTIAALVLHEGLAHAHGAGAAHGEAPHRRVANADLNMRSAMLHMVSDAAASAGVVLAGIVMLAVGGWYWLDPLVSLIIAAAIAWRAVRLLVETAAVLLESTPQGLDTFELAAAMAEVHGVESVHDLHVWSLSSDLRALAAHLVLEGHPTLEEAQVVGARVKDALAVEFAIAHATLELECEPCATEDDPCIEPGSAGAPMIAAEAGGQRGHDHGHTDHGHADHGHADHGQAVHGHTDAGTAPAPARRRNAV